MSGASDKARFYLEQSVPELKEYEKKKIFTTGTSIDLPYSKDNYFFGVQSVSDGGNESLPVVPMPDNGR